MIIFGNLMGAKLPGMSSVYSYGIYLVSGLIPWIAFSNTITRTSTVFIDKKNIINKIHFDLPILPLFIVLAESVLFMVTMIIFILILLFTGFSPSINLLLYLPIIYFIQQLFAYSLGFFSGMFVVFIRDLKEVVSIGIQIWFWFTPIVYVFEILPPTVQDILIWNPALAFIAAYHDIFIYGKIPSFSFLFILLCISIITIIFEYLIFKKLEKDIRDFI
jgi:lipopolysaccharide transport system permease protein